MPLSDEAAAVASAGAPLLATPPSNSNATRQVDDITTTNFVRLFIIFMTRPGAKTVRSQVRYPDYMTNRTSSNARSLNLKGRLRFGRADSGKPSRAAHPP